MELKLFSFTKNNTKILNILFTIKVPQGEHRLVNKSPMLKLFLFL